MSEPKPKTTTGTIIRHGEAPYQHDPNNSNNYFVEVEVEKDKFETLWGVQLKELVESQQLEAGEKASFHKFKQETGANRWEAERYFEAEKFENSVERDFEQDRSADAAPEFGQSKVKQSADYSTDDAEYIVPNAIRNRYLSVAVNKYTDTPLVKFYERDNPASVAFEDRGDKGLHTSKSDKDTVTAMLDMAQSKGWESIKLKGSEEFKREAWMEAQMRGIKTKGYEPSEKDKLELQARQAERTSNQIEATKISAVYTKEADKTSLDHAKDAGIATGTSVAMGDTLTAATAAKAVVTDKVQSLAADVVIGHAKHEQSDEKVTEAVQTADQAPDAAKREDFKKDFEENKAKLNDNDKVKVEAVRRILDYLHKDNPKELQAGYEKLTTAMKNGEISKLPDVPQQVVQQSIEIQAPTQSNKDRGR